MTLTIESNSKSKLHTLKQQNKQNDEKKKKKKQNMNLIDSSTQRKCFHRIASFE